MTLTWLDFLTFCINVILKSKLNRGQINRQNNQGFDWELNRDFSEIFWKNQKNWIIHIASKGME